MAKFCSFCGKELAEGEVCHCQDQTGQEIQTEETVEPAVTVSSDPSEAVEPEPLEGQAEFVERTDVPGSDEKTVAASYATEPESVPEQEQLQYNGAYTQTCAQGATAVQQPRTPSIWSNVFGRCLSILKHFFQHPAKAMELAGQHKDYPVGIIFYVVRALLSTIFGMVLVSHLVRSSMSVLGGRITLDVLLKQAGTSSIGLSIQMFLLTLLCDLLFVAIAFGVAKIFRSKATFVGLIASVGVGSIASTAMSILLFVLFFIIPSLIFPLMIASVVISAVFTYVALAKTYQLPDDRMVYVLPLISFVIAIVIMIYFKASDFGSVFGDIFSTPFNYLK